MQWLVHLKLLFLCQSISLLLSLLRGRNLILLFILLLPALLILPDRPQLGLIWLRVRLCFVDQLHLSTLLDRLLLLRLLPIHLLASLLLELLLLLLQFLLLKLFVG